MRLTKNKLGKVLMVRFADHAMGIDRAIECVVVGFLRKYDRKTLVLRSWDTPNDNDVDNRDSEYAIVRSTIMEMRELI